MELLKNKVAVVTGGTRGIGFAIVKTYLQNGAKVAVFGSRQETVEKALAKLREENPAWDVTGGWPDLGQYAQVEAAIAEVKAHYGRIDIFVNNAGISGRESLYEYDPAAFEKTMALNVNAVFYACRAVAPIMKEQGGGVILNTSSMVSLYGQPSGVAYPASKSAINGLTRSLARYLTERYWLRRDLGDDWGKGGFIVSCCLLVSALGEEFPENAQLFSKEVENCAENMDALMDAVYDHPAFSPENLIALLNS